MFAVLVFHAVIDCTIKATVACARWRHGRCEWVTERRKSKETAPPDSSGVHERESVKARREYKRERTHRGERERGREREREREREKENERERTKEREQERESHHSTSITRACLIYLIYQIRPHQMRHLHRHHTSCFSFLMRHRISKEGLSVRYNHCWSAENHQKA